MPDPAYDWRRFWGPRDGRVDLSDGGYLSDPDSEFGRFLNPDLVPLADLAEVPCLALIGEPGLGKSYELGLLCVRTTEDLRGTDAVALRLDLGDIEQVRDVFENRCFEAWRGGEHRMYLFLDSLDEGRENIPRIATTLLSKLQHCPTDRLYLRITCRTADWPPVLEHGLADFWGKDSFRACELAPLRRSDVETAARANGLDAGAFLDSVQDKEVVPFAIKPTTLDFLIRTYRKDGQLPPTRNKLYEQGCRLLCEELNEARLAARQVGRMAPEQRMAVAGRIAAVTALSNKVAVWTGAERGDVPGGDIAVRELCGGAETVSGAAFDVDRDAVREALATGLFSSRGENRLGWAHQTYAEFLAAWYLTDRGFPSPQVLSLVTHPGDPDGKLVPQLHETAAWLASMQPWLFRRIMETDPEVLLLSDVTTAEASDRAELVATLLRGYDEGTLAGRDLGVGWRYRKLDHPGLVEQLRPYLRDATRSADARYEAIDIAEVCDLTSLQGDLTDLALDESEPYRIRVNAAWAVCRIGDSQTKARLRPLALGEAGDDPDDELKGCGLRALWPDHLSTEDLLSLLAHPKRENLLGAYRSFLHDLPKSLSPEDLPTALSWVEGQRVGPAVLDSLAALADEFILKALDELDNQAVLEAVASIAISRVSEGESIVGHRAQRGTEEALKTHPEKRRRLVAAMIPHLCDPPAGARRLRWCSPPLVTPDDLFWIVDDWQAADTPELAAAWAELLLSVLEFTRRDHVEVAFDAWRSSSGIAAALARAFEPVGLQSQRAEEMKAAYMQEQERESRHQEKLSERHPPKPHIDRLLDECESGNLDAWWQLHRWMTLEADGTHAAEEFESDLTALPGFRLLEAEGRTRLLACARRYVLEQDMPADIAPEKVAWYRPAHAAYRGLRLLLKEDPDFLSALAPNVWAKWAPMTVAFRHQGGDARPDQQILVAEAYRHAPDKIVETLTSMISQEDREHGTILCLDTVNQCWEDRLAAALSAKVRDDTLKPDSVEALLRVLIQHGVDDAAAFAASLITSPPPPEGETREKAVVAAGVLMTEADDSGWPVVWPAIQQDTEFGRAIISILAPHPDKLGTRVAERITEEQAADLYLWLVRQYPYDEDPQIDGMHAVDVREDITRFRDHILYQIRDRGTVEACYAMQRIAAALPEQEWLQYHVQKAEAITRARTWTPPLPSHIRRLAADADLRLVDSGDQLLDLLCESLERLEGDLHAQIPAVVYLWNETPGDGYRPRHEPELCDYIARHLDADLRGRGIVVNREVQIHRGQRTDIHVDAVRPQAQGDPFGRIKAIIEVKGCWHPRLYHAMQTQLVDRYLKDTDCQHGLYVVGWFASTQWDDSCPKKSWAQRRRKDDVHKRLGRQAAELSQGDLTIRAAVTDASLD